MCLVLVVVVDGSLILEGTSWGYEPQCLFSSAKTGAGSAGLVAVTTASCSRANSGHDVSSKWKITPLLLIIHFGGSVAISSLLRKIVLIY